MVDLVKTTDEQNLQDPGATSASEGIPKPEVDVDEDVDEDEVKPPEPPAKTDGAPNIIFIGTRRVHGEEERLKEAPSQIISGPSTFSDLPSSEEQLKGFYYERAAELCRAFPGLYKRLIKKGE